MKILNLYSGVGGDRHPWGGEHEITAVEQNPVTAKMVALKNWNVKKDLILVNIKA